MSVQQLMLAQGGAPDVALPTSLSGLQFWYDGDNSLAYENDQTNVFPTTTDEDALFRIDSAGAINRVWTSSLTMGTFQNPVQGSSKGFRHAPTDNGGQIYVKPAGGASPSTAVNLSSLFSVSNAVAIFAVKVVNADVEQGGAPFLNNTLFGVGGAAHKSLHFYKSGANVVFQAFSYATGDASWFHADVTEALSTWVVITMRHTGGNMQIRKNGGAWTTVAMGNTESLAAVAGSLENNNPDVSVAQWCVCNANNSDAALLPVERGFGAKVGITI